MEAMARKAPFVILPVSQAKLAAVGCDFFCSIFELFLQYLPFL